ncbi:hypothetical protein HYH03_016804 [Edaphochlamys debaryana]|uniref:RING-type domain-containing protein n=1 Tax=Edaphochlamys debaryana TaxID=47281 RepID=A0A836BR36_9CHLO|nr:hypothetical protein HYH03_016804 [Edaphochlamys debaryana]|eukprot:KAG2484389.1 hypothetical protein HYH03_016804 [Edaphochlamys debaryana]
MDAEAEAQVAGSSPPGPASAFSGGAQGPGGAECKRRRRLEIQPEPHVPSPDEDLDATQPGWWQPQPHATLDPRELQDRPAAPITRALSCALCHGLLKEAMTGLECGHTYCYDCIEARLEVGGKHNLCPVHGCSTLFGPNPFDHQPPRLMYDTLLDRLVQKIFPRPELDAALAQRRAEREEATRQARAAVNAGRKGSTGDGGEVDTASPEEDDDVEEQEEEGGGVQRGRGGRRGRRRQ